MTLLCSSTFSLKFVFYNRSDVLVFGSDRVCVLWQVNHALLEELQQINRRLIDTIVDISTEDVDSTAAAAAAAEWVHGTIVKCSFIPVSLSPSLKSQYVSLQVWTPRSCN